jgi:tetratricopeptide (TPR) repeat protein
MRRILIGVALVLLALPAWAQTRDPNWTSCNGHDPDIAIGGCTALIQAGQENTANLAIAYNNRAYAYWAEGLYDLADADLNQAIAIKPDYGLPYFNRGNHYSHRGLNDEAILDYTHYIALVPTDPDGPYGRGVVYERTGQRDKAISDYRATLSLDPNYKGAQDGLKRLGVTSSPSIGPGTLAAPK